TLLTTWLGRLKNSRMRMAAFGALAGLVFLGVGYDGSLYFIIARHDANAYQAYRGELTKVAAYGKQYVAAHPKAAKPYLVLDAYSVQTIDYLASPSSPDTHSTFDESQHKYRLLDPALSDQTPLVPGDVVIFTQSTIPDADRYAKTYAGKLQLVEEQQNFWGQEILRVYAPAGTKPAQPAENSL